MRMLASTLAVVVAIVFAVSAFAVPPGKTVEFEGKTNGKVVFDGKIHADKGMKCNDCHTKIFQMKKGTAKITKDDHAKKYCGECHNGTKSFSMADDGNCAKCHKKS
jgi:c(7)-type cytochrome triheme protein